MSQGDTDACPIGAGRKCRVWPFKDVLDSSSKHFFSGRDCLVIISVLNVILRSLLKIPSFYARVFLLFSLEIGKSCRAQVQIIDFVGVPLLEHIPARPGTIPGTCLRLRSLRTMGIFFLCKNTPCVYRVPTEEAGARRREGRIVDVLLNRKAFSIREQLLRSIAKQFQEGSYLRLVDFCITQL